MTKTHLHDIDKKSLSKVALVLVAFILVSLLVSRLIWEEKMAKFVEKAWIWWPLLIIAYKTSSVVVAPLSWSIVYVIAWWLYWTLRGVIYNAIWNIFWMSLAYFIWRKRWAQWVRRLLWKSNTQEVFHLIEHLKNKKTFIISRITLFPLEDLINYAAGIAKIQYWWFIIASIIITTIFSTILILFGGLLF